jgi:hypothetical protein
LVVPVPSFIKKDQISVVDTKTIDHLDAYTAPRLVEYFDPDPCEARVMALAMMQMPLPTAALPQPTAPQYRGVKVEAQYDVAEYDVSILSAEDSDGLVRWLIGSYIKQKMHFFVAKVNLKRLQQSGSSYLRPLQVRYETAKFMLPLRLGTVNANGAQDLIVYALTKKGRVEASNYRTVKVPSDVIVPLFVKDDFANFYKATFEHAVARENMQGVFVEYAWDMAWCDPCAAAPMSKAELTELGALWNNGDGAVVNRFPPVPGNGNSPFVTRLHVRYDAKSFPEDLNFVETGDRDNFQGRYILHHTSTSTTACAAAKAYRASLPQRFKAETDNVANLTGWSRDEIAARIAAAGKDISQVP